MAGTSEDDCAFESDDPYLISDGAGFSFGSPYAGWHSRRGYVHEYDLPNTLPRYKPDLVAPGTHLSAAHSQLVMNPPLYRCFGGTSGAAPFVTASAVLAETWFWHKIGASPQKPSPAMIKAMLVAHADNLTGGTDFLDGEPIDNSPSIPQGWGRVNLGGPYKTQVPAVIGGLLQEEVIVAVFDQDHRDCGGTPPADARRFTGPGQHWSFQLQVMHSDKPFVAVLVYTDKYSDPAAASLKVNDLHLNIVKYEIGPQGSGHCFWGNNFEEDSWYSEDHPGVGFGTVPWDSNNTVEVVRVPPNTLDGMFWVFVKAGSIAQNAIPGLTTTSPTRILPSTFITSCRGSRRSS